MNGKNYSRIAMVLCLGTSLGLAACGRPASSGTAPSAAAQTIGAGKATGTITVWAMGTEGEMLATLAKEFEKANPGVKIQVTAIPWNAAHDKFATAITAGKTPDAAMIGTTWMGEFAQSASIPHPVRSTEVPSSPGPRRRPRSVAPRTVCPGTSRPVWSTSARTWPPKPAAPPCRAIGPG